MFVKNFWKNIEKFWEQAKNINDFWKFQKNNITLYKIVGSCEISFGIYINVQLFVQMYI